MLKDTATNNLIALMPISLSLARLLIDDCDKQFDALEKDNKARIRVCSFSGKDVIVSVCPRHIEAPVQTRTGAIKGVPAKRKFDLKIDLSALELIKEAHIVLRAANRIGAKGLSQLDYGAARHRKFEPSEKLIEASVQIAASIEQLACKRCPQVLATFMGVITEREASRLLDLPRTTLRRTLANALIELRKEHREALDEFELAKAA
jgi:hypothetical protein